MRLGALSLFVMLTLLPARMAAADLSGNWTLDGDVQGNPVAMACAMTQADTKLTGKCLINGTEQTEIEGTAQDSSFKFTFTVQGYTLTYTGSIEGETISGDIEVAGATGKFTGKRA